MQLGKRDMDNGGMFWYFSDIMSRPPSIPAFELYGERHAFPDILDIETIWDRAHWLDWTIAPHRHLQLHQIIQIAEGETRMTMDGQAITLTPPCVVNLPAGTVHSFNFPKTVDGAVLTLPVAEWPDLFAEGVETAEILSQPFTGPCDSGLAGPIARLIALKHDTGPFRRTRQRAATLELVLRVIDAKGKSVTRTRRMPDPRVARLRALAEAEPSLGLTVTDCARRLGVSPRHLSRLCVLETGISAQGLLHAAVFREACRLLAYSTMPVSAVGNALGFEDPSYFTRAFQRQMALSPSAYRAQFDGTGERPRRSGEVG